MKQKTMTISRISSILLFWALILAAATTFFNYILFLFTPCHIFMFSTLTAMLVPTISFLFENLPGFIIGCVLVPLICVLFLLTALSLKKNKLVCPILLSVYLLIDVVNNVRSFFSVMPMQTFDLEGFVQLIFYTLLFIGMCIYLVIRIKERRKITHPQKKEE